MGGLNKTAVVLANIGAINWGLTLLGWNAVDALIGSWSTIVAKIVYAIIALCGIWGIIILFKK